jgi:hypothetical protein
VLAIHGISSQRKLRNWPTAAALRTFRSGLHTLVAVRQLAGVDHAASIMSPAGALTAAGFIAAALA